MGPQAMITYQLGDHVRIDIPDETDPGFELHGERGLATAVERSQSCEHAVYYEPTLENPDYEFTIEAHS